jgi:predicted metal-dependent HD superfamily phosphohydrolase
MIKDHFVEAVQRHSDESLAARLWQELEKQYTNPNRHYHTLAHLDNVLSELLPHTNRFVHWDTIVFAIAYHDSIYNTRKNNNEERSAELAVKRLTEISFPEAYRERCSHLIRATQKHEPADEETNLFTDADLSILGAAPVTYQTYTQQIRREYSLYPDFLYKPGRRKVLQHFIAMKSIYKTKPFRERYETNAKVNLEAELRGLNV